MPIPFLFIGLGAATAAVGAGKTIKARNDQKEANEVNDSAKRKIEKCTEKANLYRKNSGDSVTNLGEKKIQILNESIKPFITSFEKIHDIEFENSYGLDELSRFIFDKQSMSELKEMGNIASSIVSGVAGGAAFGAVTAFGAYGAAMTFGAASTGTAIATLSGAAATNATLAFLGGGALSVGGLGIAGGTAVLGGLVAGPALAVMGFVVGAKAEANKNEAYSNMARANEFEEEMKNVCLLCRGIRMRTEMFNRLLIKLNCIFNPLVNSLEEIIESSGTDYRLYSIEQKKTISLALSMAGAIKKVLDTPILTKEGNITPESEKIAIVMEKEIANFKEVC